MEDFGKKRAMSQKIMKSSSGLRRNHLSTIRMRKSDPLLRVKVFSGDYVDSKDYLHQKEGFWIEDTVIEAFLKAIATESTYIHNSRSTILGSQL